MKRRESTYVRKRMRVRYFFKLNLFIFYIRKFSTWATCTLHSLLFSRYWIRHTLSPYTSTEPVTLASRGFTSSWSNVCFELCRKQSITACGISASALSSHPETVDIRQQSLSLWILSLWYLLFINSELGRYRDIWAAECTLETVL